MTKRRRRRAQPRIDDGAAPPSRVDAAAPPRPQRNSARARTANHGVSGDTRATGTVWPNANASATSSKPRPFRSGTSGFPEAACRPRKPPVPARRVGMAALGPNASSARRWHVAKPAAPVTTSRPSQAAPPSGHSNVHVALPPPKSSGSSAGTKAAAADGSSASRDGSTASGGEAENSATADGSSATGGSSAARRRRQAMRRAGRTNACVATATHASRQNVIVSRYKSATSDDAADAVPRLAVPGARRESDDAADAAAAPQQRLRCASKQG